MERPHRFIDFVSDIHRRMADLYGPIAWFEHGIGKGQQGGCGVSHAHLHLLPLARREVEECVERISRDFALEAFGRLDRFLACTPSDSSYIALGTRDLAWGFYTEDVPSQFVRRAIAQVVGSNAFDWRDYTGSDVLAGTHSDLAT